MKNLSGVLLFGLLLSSTAQATLINRGSGLIYDDVLNITWLQDANYAATNTFGLATGTPLGEHPSDPDGYVGFITASGTMNWPGALFWIDAMNAVRHLGYDDWRLPITVQPDPSCSQQGGTAPNDFGLGFDCTGSEMGSLYKTTGVTQGSQDPFTNVQSYYWSGTEFNSGLAWVFGFGIGSQRFGFKYLSGLSGWAVRSGDVVGVPAPATVLLIGVGLGLLGFGRRERRR